MTIHKGVPWGEPGLVPDDAVVCDDDGAVAAAHDRVVMVGGGDLHMGLGMPRVKRPGEECTILPVDLMRVTVETADGAAVHLSAVAHVCIGRFGARGGFSGLVNAGFVDGLNLAPRGHPGDGRVELVTVDAGLPWRQRLMARRRAVTGTHVPHPMIDVAVRDAWTASVEDGNLNVDGVVIPGARRVSVSLEPGRVRVAV